MDAKLAELKNSIYVNCFLVAPHDVAQKLNLDLPWGYRAIVGESTHRYAETEIPAPAGRNVDEAVLVGFVRVHSGDPHYPIWIYRERQPMQWSIAKVAHVLGISPRRVRALAVARKVGTRTEGGFWLFTAEDVEAMRERRPGRPHNE